MHTDTFLWTACLNLFTFTTLLTATVTLRNSWRSRWRPTQHNVRCCRGIGVLNAAAYATSSYKAKVWKAKVDQLFGDSCQRSPETCRFWIFSWSHSVRPRRMAGSSSSFPIYICIYIKTERVFDQEQGRLEDKIPLGMQRSVRVYLELWPLPISMAADSWAEKCKRQAKL